MAVLGIDGGAERMGWSLLERGKLTPAPVYLDSGLVTFPKLSGTFQTYRLDLIKHYVTHFGKLLDDEYVPVDEVVNEIVPAVGSYGGTQMYLVNVAMTAVQTMAMQRGIPVSQIGATTVHSRIAVGRTKGKKVSKVQVRNGVFELLPELKARKREWVKVFDEPDAIAINLAYLGYKNGN